MQALEINEFKQLIEQGYAVIDTRKPEIFCDSFIEESINIPFDDNFVDTYDELTEPGQKVIIVADEAHNSGIAKALKGAAIDSAEGYLKGGYEAWQNAGNKTDMLIPIDTDEFAIDYKYDEFFLIDVRSKEEYAKEHVEDSENIVLNDLEQILIEFETNDSYYIYGNTLSEAVTAGSIFKRIGFNRVRVIAAGFEELKAAGIPFFSQKKKDDKAAKFSDN